MFVYGGVSSNLSEFNYAYKNLGIRMSLGPRNLFFFNGEIMLARRKSKYTYFAKDDYAYTYNRNGFGAGFDMNFNLVPKLFFRMGFNVYATTYKSELNTDDPFLKQILLPSFNESGISLSFTSHLNYQISNRSGIFLRYQGNIQSKAILHSNLLGVGYEYRIFGKETSEIKESTTLL